MAELTRRYIVMTMSADGPFDLEDPEAPFVLKPWKDPAAVLALEAYRSHCYPELAEELGRWIEAIRAGAMVRGGVGRRNEEHMAARSRLARPAGRTRPRPAVRGAAAVRARTKAKKRKIATAKRKTRK